MKRIVSVAIVFVLILSLPGCNMNVAQELTTYTATFTMSVQYDLSDNDGLGTECFPMIVLTAADTYMQIIHSDRVLNTVSEELNFSLTASQIREMLSMEAVEDNSTIKISVTSKDFQLSLDTAEAIAKVAPDKILGILEGSNAQIIDSPKVRSEISLRNLFR